MELATEQQVRARTFYELAILDPLTGLYNRRFCEERLKSEIQRADRQHLPLMVVTVDLDHFKQINDSFGHAAGDTVLREFSRHLNKTIRGADFAVRLGGDEFLLVLPECPPEYVGLVMSRLTPLQVDCDGIVIAVRASRGWAQYIPEDTPETLIERADRVLYEQKQSRRASTVEDLAHA